MTIELTRQILKDQAFNSGLAKLSRYTGFPPTKLRKVSKLLKKLRGADRGDDESWQKMIDPFIQKDAEGKIIPQMGPDNKPLPNTFAIADDKKEAFTKAVEEYNKTPVKVEAHTIHINDLTGVGITPNEFLALEPLVHGLDVMEGGNNGEKESEENQESEEKSH